MYKMLEYMKSRATLKDMFCPVAKSQRGKCTGTLNSILQKDNAEDTHCLIVIEKLPVASSAHLVYCVLREMFQIVYLKRYH